MAKKAKTTLFIWEGVNKQGTVISGEMSALNPVIVKAELRRQNITPKKIKKKPVPLFGFNFKDRIKPVDIAIITRQLSTMISAGVPIVQALNILAQGQTNPKLQTMLNSIKYEIESGINLATALAKYPQQFNKLFCSLVNAGEQSGSLDVMLSRLASYREKIESLKGKIKKALFYPIAVLVIAFVISMGLLIFIVPQFARIYEGFGAQLPTATLVVIKISHVLQSYWWIVFSLIGLGLWGVSYLRKTSAKFAYNFDKFLLKIYIIGPILRKAIIARVTRTLSTTFSAGMPMVDALQAVAVASGNLVYQYALDRIKDEVETGTPLNTTMRSAFLFPSMVVQMVAIGEEAGSLEFMLEKVADFYDEQVDNAVNSLSSLIEPLIMAVLGVIIGGLVIAMYLPIFKLGGVVSG